jgi:hypothetical protein
MDLSSLRIVPTNHFIKVIKDKGFDPDKILNTLTNPAEVYESRNHPGQWRVTGNGLCLVGKPEGNTFTLITAYLDRVITDLRPDQIAAGHKINRKG